MSDDSEIDWLPRPTALCIGNGESRLGLDLRAWPGPTLGCNALYRDFEPDLLFCVDTPIAREIAQSGYATRRPVMSRVNGLIPGSEPLRPYAVENRLSSGAACFHEALSRWFGVVLLGFDMGTPHGNRISNVYAGTRGYRRRGHTHSFRQTAKDVRHFREIIRRHGRSTVWHLTDLPSPLADLPRVRVLPVGQYPDLCRRFAAP